MVTTTPTILVVNPNTNVATTDMLVAVARRACAHTEFEIHGVTAASGPRMIVDADALAGAAEHAVAAALEGIERYRPSAVIIGAFGDPGAEGLRSATSVPVFGIGRSSVRAAAAGNRRFAIATTTGGLVIPIVDLVRTTCPDGDFAGVFLSAGDPLTLAADPEATTRELGIAVGDAAAAGAEVVIIGGGPLSNAAGRLASRTDVAIIEPVPSAVSDALIAVSTVPT